MLMVVVPLVAGVLIGEAFHKGAFLRTEQATDVVGVYERLAQKGRATDDPILGRADAPVTVEVWSDFECPWCSRFAQMSWDSLVMEYVAAGKVRVVYKYLPLPFHPNAPFAAMVGMCANEQGKFWQLHDLLYANYRQLQRENVLRLAEQVGVALKQLHACLADTAALQQKLQSTMQEAQIKGVRGTPTLVVNGELVVGARPFFQLKPIIEEKLGGR